MVKVITYGTYDMLHYGHILLLERAKALGDYLIVGITSSDFDKTRGKINVQQSLMERIEAVKATGLADEVIIEEYEGQKIDDIRRLGVDIFTVGSDWKGKFDYLNEFCKVVYLDRTEGISSSQLRANNCDVKLGIIGNSSIINKVINEGNYVNGLEITSICTENKDLVQANHNFRFITEDYAELLDKNDAVYIISQPEQHYEQIKLALEKKKHVMCEAPIALKKEQCKELFDLADRNGCVLFELIKTAYSTAYLRMLLLIKDGRIGDIVSVDASCTSMANFNREGEWSSMTGWGPTALLPIFQILGNDYKQKSIVSLVKPDNKCFDYFSKIDFIYNRAVASIKVGTGAKTEGELIITGTKGYIYVPAPWWKTDYFEVRYENIAENKRYFYQLDGEGIRYALVAFIKSIRVKSSKSLIDRSVSETISAIMQDFYEGNCVYLK